MTPLKLLCICLFKEVNKMFKIQRYINRPNKMTRGNRRYATTLVISSKVVTCDSMYHN